jgi:hypothetical protein
MNLEIVRIKGLLKLVASFLLIGILFISCENSDIYLAEDTLENPDITETETQAVEKSCTIPSGGAMTDQADFGVCTVTGFGNISTFKPDDPSFVGLDSCTINAYAIQYDYSLPSAPTCQVFNCRVHRGAPCI